MQWQTDILGAGFEQLTINLKDDYEGKAIATLIRRLNPATTSNTAILYIHGFNDYFFLQEMGIRFNSAGYNFYALDLRKYGRSHLPHQKFNDTRNLKDYYEEINKAIEILKAQNQKIILMGHSTGGLIVTLFAKDNTKKSKFDGVILNSPFFDFNMSSKILEKLIPFASAVGKLFPSIKVSDVLHKEYGESLHKDYEGEWDYNLEWKPSTPPPISLGWLRAICKGHKELRKKFTINEPVLVLHSARTITDKLDKIQMHSMDAVLSVADIKRVASHIEGDVQITAIAGGMHDLILSKKEVRDGVYQAMFDWLQKNI